MSGSLAEHWDDVYRSKTDDEVSWYQPTPITSLRLLQEWASPDGGVVDVGGGASTLVDRLLEAGWADLTVLDVSEEALRHVRSRLGDGAERVQLVVADVGAWHPGRRYGAWHDRAVFHFLVAEGDRDRYVAVASDVVAPGGVVVLGTFALDGPTQCSGLPTARYGPDEITRAFGPSFTLEHVEGEDHTTPSGSVQRFSWFVLRRTEL